jgi:cell division protein FtsI (penicillin-binding protein 3)
MRSPALRISRRRIGIARAVLVIAFAALGFRAFRLALDPRSLERATAQSGAWLRVAAERGLIVDRDGAELGISVDAPSIYARPRQVRDPDATARALARALGMDRRGLAARLRRDSRFVFLARWVEPKKAERVRKLDLAGIEIAMEPRRRYPHGELAASVLGFANIDALGVRGIEQQEDRWLRGTPQIYRVERDARGELLGIAGLERTAAAGGDVRLTLDAGFQAATETALAEAVAEAGARGGIVVAMDPHTGEVLALAERPSFDPNRFRELHYPSTRSRAFQDAMEPGSTFKAFLMAGALEADAVGVDDWFETQSGSYRVPGKTITDVHPHGPLQPEGILRVSSNVGAVMVAEALGAERHFEILRAFGFGRPTGSGFPFESAGLLRPWRQWRPVDHATVAFGQGLSVTAIQMAAATSALANGGILLRPRLVAARRQPGGVWSATRPERVRRVISSETAARVVRMLEGVVSTEGTARRARLRDVRVAGKTGTAQILDEATGTYSTNRYHSWFVGIAPADGPRIVVACILHEARLGFHHGGRSAAPLFARVAEMYLAGLGLMLGPEPRRPSRAAAVVAAAPDPPRAQPAIEPLTSDGQNLFLPDLRGLTVAQVRAITESAALELEIVGSGLAVDQDPDPGTILAGSRKRVRVHFVREGEEG